MHNSLGIYFLWWQESGAHGHCYHHTVVANSCHICLHHCCLPASHAPTHTRNNTPTSRIWYTYIYTVKDDMPTAICTAYMYTGFGVSHPWAIYMPLPDAMGSPQTKFLRSPCGHGCKACAKIWFGGWALRMSVFCTSRNHCRQFVEYNKSGNLNLQLSMMSWRWGLL